MISIAFRGNPSSLRKIRSQVAKKNVSDFDKIFKRLSYQRARWKWCRVGDFVHDWEWCDYTMWLVKFIIIAVGQIDQFDESIWIYCRDTPLPSRPRRRNTTKPRIRLTINGGVQIVFLEYTFPKKCANSLTLFEKKNKKTKQNLIRFIWSLLWTNVLNLTSGQIRTNRYNYVRTLK